MLLDFEHQVTDGVDKCLAPADVAAEVERLNDVLGLPSSLRDMGYEKADMEDMATAAEAHYFNTTAPRRPSVADYKTLLGEVLG